MNNQNLLYRTRTYLVGHMERVSDQVGQTWRNKVTDELEKLGIVVFNPYNKPFVIDVEEGKNIRERLNSSKDNGEYDYVSERMRQIRIFDLNLVDRSDFIIANINPSLPSWGSTEEIVTAVRMKKPIFLISEGGKRECPLWVFGMFPHRYIYESIEDVLYEIKNIDSGETPMDGRWRLLKKEYR